MLASDETIITYTTLSEEFPCDVSPFAFSQTSAIELIPSVASATRSLTIGGEHGLLGALVTVGGETVLSHAEQRTLTVI